MENLNKVFGVVSYSPAVSTYGNYEDIEKTLGEYVDNLVDDGFIGKDTRFAIKCRRVGNHDFTSQEMAAFCGSVVVKKVGCPVDLTNPELKIYVEVRDDEALFIMKKLTVREAFHWELRERLLFWCPAVLILRRQLIL